MRVTVQELKPPESRLDRPQRRAATVRDGVKVRVVVWELLPSVAVITAVCVVVKVPDEAVKPPEVVPAGTLTERGTVRAGLLDVKVTAAPDGVGWLSITTQVVEASTPRVDIAHCRLEIAIGGIKASVTVWILLPRTAVITADCPVATAAAVAVKMALAEPAETVTEGGTARLALLSLSVTVVLEGAAWFKLTVQIVLAGVFKTVGLQVSEFKLIGDPPETVTVPAVPVVGIAPPASEAPNVSVTAMEVLLVTVGERVTDTTATTPLEITLELTPATRQL